MVFSELVIAPLVIGMGHSIETDHVLAVGNLMDMKKGNTIEQAYKGASWGLGHTISVAIGVLLIETIKSLHVFPEELPLEVFAGLLLVLLGSLKLWRFINPSSVSYDHKKKDFFHIGLVHGLAGSGTVAILLTGQRQEIWDQASFLLLFGIGTILGMAIITGVFTRFHYIQTNLLSIISCSLAFLSIAYGLKIIINQVS